MLLLLSPAKSLDFDTPAGDVAPTRPAFQRQAGELIELLRQKSPQEVATLMKISDTLAGLNVARYQAWRSRASASSTRPAVLAFNGDVYEGLAARTLPTSSLDWLQDHACILSGLYGVLRPLDLIQPYRLEMGTALANARGSNLYRFWNTQIADYLNARLKGDANPMIVNLASREYFKSVDLKRLKARVVDCVFEDFSAGQYAIISFYAKRARGLMARFAAMHGLTAPAQLQSFDLEGYRYDATVSEPDRMVFRRGAE